MTGILDGILNEIAPSALLPRNDGILEFPTMSSSGLTRGSLYGILEFLMLFKIVNYIYC